MLKESYGLYRRKLERKKGCEYMESDNIKWLTTVPATDGNFKNHLKAATTEEIKKALSVLKANGEKGCVSKISALSRELRRRRKDA